MAIANRLRRLFRADAHAVLDIIEEPDAILKQSIREMQEALDWKRARLNRNENTLKSLRNNEGYLKGEVSKVRKDLELCMQEGSEELARKTVGRKLSLEKHLVALQQRISSLGEVCEQRTQEINLQEGQLESILEKARMFVQTATEDSAFSVAESILSTAEHGAGGRYAGSGLQVSEEEIELEWIRIQDGLKKGGAS